MNTAAIDVEDARDVSGMWWLHARRLGDDGWWLMLTLGVLEIVVAFWAVRYPGRSIALLVLWVGIAAVARGLALIFTGFAFRAVRPVAA